MENKSKVWPQWLAASITHILAVMVGLISGWTSPFLAKLTKGEEVIKITNDEASWIAALLSITRVVGAIIAAVIVRQFGAKKAVLLNGIPHALGWACFLIEESVSSIYTSRLLSGFALGMFYSTFPLFIGEISNPNIRGALIGLITQGLPIGTLIGNLLGAYINMKQFAIFSLVLSIVFFISFIFFPDSPHYLVQKKRMKDAEKALKWYNRRQDVSGELESLKLFTGQQDKLSFREILIQLSLPINRKIFMTVICIYIFMQLSGLYTITLYLEIILSSLKVEIIKPSLLVVCVGLIGIISGLLAMYTNDHYGRRIMLAISSFGISINLFLLGINFILLKQDYDSTKLQWLTIIAIFLYQFFMCMGIIPVPSCLMSEMFPPQLKEIGTCMANITSAIFAFIISKSYQPMLDAFSEEIVFFFYGFLMLSMFIFTLIFLPETKGKSLQEIQEMLMKEKTDNNDSVLEKYAQTS